MAEVDTGRYPGSGGTSESPAGEPDPGGGTPEPEARQSRSGALLKLGTLALLLVGGYLVVRATPAGDYLSSEGIGEAIAWLRGNPWAPVTYPMMLSVNWYCNAILGVKASNSASNTKGTP